MITEAQVTAALEALGSTSEEVAFSLEIEGVKGVRGQSQKCPLSILLQKRFPDKMVGIGIGHASIFDLRGYIEVNTSLPTACIEFVASFDFDNGWHPELQEES